MAHTIKKSSGKWERFSTEKLQNSLRKVGANEELIEAITSSVLKAPELRTTEDLYQYVYLYLKISDRLTAARYSLKQALYELGPQKEPFTQFIAKMYAELQYTTRTNHRMKGLCAQYDTDIIIDKDEQHYLIESVFQPEPGSKTDIKPVLAIKALFEDLSAKWKQAQDPFVCNDIWLITNGAYTREAEQYGLCAKIKLIGWGYEESLQDIIEKNGLYPITCLTGLTYTQKKILVQKNFLLCKEILGRRYLLSKIQVGGPHISAVLDECKALAGN